MELVIKDIKSTQDLKLFTELAKRLGLKTAKLTLEEKEDSCGRPSEDKGPMVATTSWGEILIPCAVVTDTAAFRYAVLYN